MSEPRPAAAFYDQLWRAEADRENRRRAGFQRALVDRALAWVGGGGLTVLELGPGAGHESARLVAAGARLVAVDVARSALERTREATAGAARIALGAAERLPLRDASVDVVFTQTMLMHVDLAGAAAEWARVLRPGGRAVLLEPLAGHPLLRLYRRFSAYRQTSPRYLRLGDLERAAPGLVLARHEEHYLLAVAALAVGGAPGRWLQALLEPIDRALFQALPGLRRHAWMTLAELRREE